MKLLQKIALTTALFVALAGVFVVARKVGGHQVNNQKLTATTKMYNQLKNKGKYRSAKGNFTVLTEKGQELLKPNLSFEGDPDKPKKNIGFDIKKSFVTKGATEGYISIPKDLKPGDVIGSKLPFPTDLLTGNTQLTLILPEREIIYNRNHIQRLGDDKNGREFGLMVGYNYFEGKRIKDDKYLAAYKGQKVRYRLEGEFYTKTSVKKANRSVYLKNPLIFFSDVDYKTNNILYTFQVIAYQRAPRIYNLTANLDGKDVKKSLDVQIYPIKSFSKDVKKYQITVRAKNPLQGKKLEISNTLLGKLSFANYSSQSYLPAL